MFSRLSVNVTAAMSSYSQIVSKKMFATINNGRMLNLNDMGSIPDANKIRKRWGRGIGSGKGKTSGHGHQKSRSTPRAFEGGQTPLYKRLPKIGFHNHGHREFQVLNLEQLQNFVNEGRLKPLDNGLITMRDLLHSGLISQIQDGVKILYKTGRTFDTKIHLEVSQASQSAIEAVEKAGGTVTCVHFNKLALRALTKPFKFDILPRRARPVPRMMEYYLDCTRAGYLSPEVQIRNMKLFGAVTSEERYREEHDKFMVTKRKLLWPQDLPGYDAATHVENDSEEKKAISKIASR